MHNLWSSLKVNLKETQKGKQRWVHPKINQPTAKRKPITKVKKEVNVIEGGTGGTSGGLTSDEQEMLETLKASGDTETDTVDDTTEETSEESDSEEIE